MPWLLHRIAVSRRYQDSLREITDEWGLEEVVVANEVLDALEDAADRAARSREVTRGR